jgi:hypothetical protein
MDLEQKEARIERDGERARKGAIAAMWMLFLVVAVIWLGKRSYEWDVLAYSGCVWEINGETVEAVHAKVYTALDTDAPPEVADALRSKNEYRQRLSEDPAAFASQLPFYRGRVLYIGPINALMHLGVSPIDGAFIISWLAGVALLIACGLWLQGRGGGARSIVLGNLLLLVALGFFFKAPTKATPDPLAAALLIWGAYLLLETRRVAIGLAFLALCLAVRSDSIVLTAPLVLWCTLGWSGGKRVSWNAFAAWGAASTLLLLACTTGRQTYGPWIVFQHTFVEYMAFPLRDAPPFDLGAWAKQSLFSLPKFRAFAPLLFTLAGVVTLIRGYRRGGWRDPSAGLAALALLATFAHFALFPALWPRLMFPYWALTALALGRGPSSADSGLHQDESGSVAST